MNSDKQQIFNYIKHDTPELISYTLIKNYLKKYPGDIDIITIKAYIDMLNDNIDSAISTLDFVLKKSPFDVDALFLIGQAYNEIKDFYNAIISLGKSQTLASYYKANNQSHNVYLFFDFEICSNLSNTIINTYTQQIISHQTDNIDYNILLLKEIKKNITNHYDLFDDIIRTNNDIIGKTFSNNPDDIRFCASYSTTDYLKQTLTSCKSLIYFKTEMLKQFKFGTDINFNLKNNSLVPIAATELETVMNVTLNNKESISIPINWNLHFNYYKIPSSNVSIHSNKSLIVGEPVSLMHNKKNKRLVISLFVDGLSQYFLNKYGLENIMPNTYNFFKHGMICKNAFTSSDWTYPSLSSMISGQYVPNHMMIHPKINIKFQKDQKLLFEYFKEAGYHTSMISGEWRSCATYDSIRGIDRYIALHPDSGFRTEDVISNAIDSIETFKDTDQYIWIGTNDLHDIADEINLPAVVQASLDLTNFHTTHKAINSVKQDYDLNKIEAYKRVAHNIDLKLQPLYNYIESNFNDDEYVISIFGDHGQAYFIKPNKYHLSREFSNICFMTRGGNISGVSLEYINITDYTNIITKLSGLENLKIENDGSLPKTYGGSSENKFAITETIHPGDPYMAAIHSPQYTFYLTSLNPLTQNGKIDLSKYETILLNKDNIEIHNQKVTDLFTNYILSHTKYIQIY